MILTNSQKLAVHNAFAVRIITQVMWLVVTEVRSESFGLIRAGYRAPSL